MSTSPRVFLPWRWVREAVLGLVWTVAVASGQEAVTSTKAPDLRLDFSRGGIEAPLKAEVDRDGYGLAVSARFDRPTQTLSLTGTLRMRQAMEPESVLSYQLYGVSGELLQWDGKRIMWESTASAERVAHFEINFPLMENQPWRSALRLQFNAVVEGQYWYNQAHPEVVFPLVELVKVPPRDHYRPSWVWLPAVLPAQTRCLIPAAWEITTRDDASSGFMVSMDVENPLEQDRVESTRLAFDASSILSGHVFTWLPLGPLKAGEVQARPGLVWEGVRWYQAEDWFVYETVSVIPPLRYVGGAMFSAWILVVVWSWTGRWRRFPLKVVGRTLVLIGAWWMAANLVISGYWMVIAILAGVAMVKRIEWSLPGTRSYAVSWLLLSFIEIYWGRMSGIAPVRMSATGLAVATWALILLPLVLIRRGWLRRSLAAFVIVGWLIISTASVVYFQFFQDFPSVENLLYAGQLGELGESIRSLVEQRHLIPFLVTTAALVIWWWPSRRGQRNTHIENT